MKAPKYITKMDYKNQEVKPVPVVQIFALMLALLFIIVAFKMCFDKPHVVTIQELNADRR